jgi:transposase InsO family protein
VVHSDRGSQFRSAAFVRTLAPPAITHASAGAWPTTGSVRQLVSSVTSSILLAARKSCPAMTTATSPTKAKCMSASH